MRGRDRWAGSIFALILLAAALRVLSGCGGVPSEVRTATVEVARAVDQADATAAGMRRVRHAELRAEILDMLAAARFASQTAISEWYEARMAPYREVERVLEAAETSLRAVEFALDAWDAGASDAPNRTGDALACSVAAVAEAVGVLTAVGVEVPDALKTWGSVIARYAASGCPEPEPPAPDAGAPDAGAPDAGAEHKMDGGA